MNEITVKDPGPSAPIGWVVIRTRHLRAGDITDVVADIWKSEADASTEAARLNTVHDASTYTVAAVLTPTESEEDDEAREAVAQLLFMEMVSDGWTWCSECGERCSTQDIERRTRVLADRILADRILAARTPAMRRDRPPRPGGEG